MDSDVLSVLVEQNGQGPVARLTGDLDMASAPALRKLLEEHAGDALTLDFSGVTFMDSTAIGVLVAAHERAEELDGRIVLRDVQQPQMRLFEITGVTDRLAFEAADAERASST